MTAAGLHIKKVFFCHPDLEVAANAARGRANASDQFFEWQRPESPPDVTDAEPKPAPPAKPRPKTLIAAVALLAGDTPDGREGLGALGQYLKRTDPAFSVKVYGHATLSDMVRTYPDLLMTQ